MSVSKKIVISYNGIQCVEDKSMMKKSMKMKKVFHILCLLPFLMGILSLAAGAIADTSSPEVHVLHVDGTIVPVIADYIDRGISRAEDEGAAVVVIELKTPGGMLTTTEDIVDRILEAEVPVVVYVDRWAGSAGTFITMASHVAAMAPASRIGAASPVSGSGEEISETLEKKLQEDTRAHIRSLADLRGRNQKAAEATVAEALSFTDQEALGMAPVPSSHREVLEMGSPCLVPPLVDLGAEDIYDLLDKLDGREVVLDSGTATIHTEGYTIHKTGMNLIERFLHAICDPNIAYILLSIGSLGIILELYSPGSIIPGVTGALSLLMSFYALSVLDAYWAGVLLILLAFGLFAAELFTSSFGLLSSGGVAALVIGSLILFSGGTSMADFGVDWWLIVVVVVGVVGFLVFALYAVVRAQRSKQPTGAPGLIGKEAQVRTALDPRGTVMVHGELWEAVLDEGRAEPEEEVIITEVEGLKLKVTRKEKEVS
ncbi:MAG: nodulation protein NfeD [Dehalococcoidia bacterium]